MPHYLLEMAYAPHGWDAQIKNPHNRIEQVAGLLQRLGARFESVYYSFGEYDIVAVAEFPDNVSAASFSLVISAGGTAKAVKTTPLLTIDEGIQAMRKGHEVTSVYTPPSASATPSA